MIDFRYYIVSIVSVFLALAIGLVLGATTLQNFVLQDLHSRTDSLAAANEKQQATIDELKKRIKADGAFAEAVGPTLVSGDLAGQSVVLISAPGVDSGVRSKLRSLIRTAGASVSADIRLKSSYVDPAKSSELDAVATGLANHAHIDLPAGAAASTKAAVVLGTALVAPPDAQVSSSTFRTALTAFANGGLISVTSGQPQPGTLALVLTGPAPGTHRQATRSALLALARELDQHSAGAVLASPTAPSGHKDVVSYARARRQLTRHVSTVDDVDTPAGQIASVLALTGQLRGHAGQYGSAGGATSPLPSPVPTTTPSTTPTSAEPSPSGS